MWQRSHTAPSEDTQGEGAPNVCRQCNHRVMNGEMKVVAVIDANATQTIVWWVSLEAALLGHRRRCGAWVFDRNDAVTFHTVIAARSILATQNGRRAMAELGLHPDSELDLQATYDAVIAELLELRRLFDEEQAKRLASKRFTEPTWPTISPMIDMSNPPLQKGAPSPTQVILGVTGWLVNITEAWDALEELRVRRPRLYGDRGTELRPVPMVVTPS